MRRSLSARISIFVFLVLMSAPVFASAPRDDSPFDRFERAITRIVQQVKKVLQPTILDSLNIPKP